MAAAVASPPSTPLVRVEDSTSIGRAYSSAQQRSVPGLGARRAALTTRSLVPPPEGSVLESLTMRSVHLARASREEVLAYFRNTWELTETLFAALASDAVFYMVPDTLRRPLIFYFGHPAALYINKGHQAGLVGESPLAGVPPGVPRARGGGGGGGGGHCCARGAVLACCRRLCARGGSPQFSLCVAGDDPSEFLVSEGSLRGPL